MKTTLPRLVLGQSLASLGFLAVTACSPPASETPPSDAPEAAAPATSAVVFIGARVIIGDGTDPIENATFVVDDGRFVAVGSTGAITVPEGTTHIDLAGLTVMPAIIDTHVHLSRERDALVTDLKRRAYFGVGGAMSLGQDSGDAVFQVQNETIDGAARYFTAGRGITRPEPGRSDIPYWISSADEGRAAVREQAALGVDIIKIWVDDRNGMYEKLTPDLYGPIIEEAHQNGLRVTAHIFTLADAKDLLRADVDAFAHGVRDTDVDDEIVAMLKERPEFVVVPNLADRGVATDLSWLEGILPANELEELKAAATDRPDQQAVFAIQARNLARFDAEGVRIALGTDGNIPWSAHLEMADMVTAGMAPHEVIVASTRNAAELVGRADAGTVAAGKSADFVVLEANPLDDIMNTRSITAVYLRGAEVDRTAYE